MAKKPLSLLTVSQMRHAATTHLAERTAQEHLFTSRIDVCKRTEDVAKWHELIVGDGLAAGNFRPLFGDDRVFCKSSNVEGVAVAPLSGIVADMCGAGGPCIKAADLLTKKIRDNVV